MTRLKSKKLLYTFSTTIKALRMEEAARSQKAPGRLIPIPATISAGCGMAWCAPWEAKEELESLVQRLHLEVEGTYELWL